MYTYVQYFQYRYIGHVRHCLKCSSPFLQASRYGYHEYDALLPDLGPEAAERMRLGCLDFQRRAEDILAEGGEGGLGQRKLHFANELLAETRYCTRGFQYKTHLGRGVSMDKMAKTKSRNAHF